MKSFYQAFLGWQRLLSTKNQWFSSRNARSVGGKRYFFWGKKITNLKAQDGPITGIWVFPKIMVPQNGWFIMEHPIKMDDFGGTTIFWNIYLGSRTMVLLGFLFCMCSPACFNWMVKRTCRRSALFSFRSVWLIMTHDCGVIFVFMCHFSHHWHGDHPQVHPTLTDRS